MNPITRFLLWCSMTDLTTLNKLPTDQYESSRSSQAMLGMFVLLTGCFALVYGTYAAWLIIGSLYGAILLGLLFAVFIFSIDRAIVGQHNKWTLLPRFLLAIAVALVISVPLELRISQEPIQEAIRAEAYQYNKEQGLAKNIAVLQHVKQDDDVFRYMGWGLKLLLVLFGSTSLIASLIYNINYQ